MIRDHADTCSPLRPALRAAGVRAIGRRCFSSCPLPPAPRRRDHARPTVALGKALGHPVIVDNQPGAGGIVGLQGARQRSAADGMTLGRGLEQRRDLPERAEEHAVRHAGRLHADRGGGLHAGRAGRQREGAGGNAKEFIALLRRPQRRHDYASGGNGTILHLASAMFLDEAKVSARHIPYKGVGPMITDLIGGQIDFATAALPSVQGHLKSGSAARDRHRHGAARRRGAGDSDLRRTRPARLPGQRLVRRRRAQGSAARRGAARARGGGRGVR
jgi:hypothetical protein